MARALVYSKRRTTPNQNKKLYTQMNEQELNYLVNEVNKIKSVTTTRHADDKLRQLDLNINLIKELLGHFGTENIVEYNTGRGTERRVLVQDKTHKIKCTNGRYVYGSYVIDLDDNKIVTAWVNYTNDKHKNCDMSYYNANLQIIK